MTREKLTDEDMRWLERRLSAAMPPVTPRAEFVDGARRALLDDAPAYDDVPTRQALWPVALLLLAAALSVAIYKRWRFRHIRAGRPRQPVNC